MGSKEESWGLLRLNEHHNLTFNMDIVAVHGFQGDRLSSWTHSNSFCWLQDLPLEANVYTYGYSAWASIESSAQGLIQALDTERMYRENFEVPIAFVAIGSGGLIVKQALILLASFRARSQTQILTNTVSLLFFDVPHRSELSTTIRTMTKMANIMAPWTGGNGEGGSMFQTKRELTTMMEGFAPISNRLRIYTFCNTLRNSNSTFARLELSMGLGDVMNHYMGLPNEELLYINATYAEMCKFPSHQSADCRTVLAILRRTGFQDGVEIGNRGKRHVDQIFRLDGSESETAKQWFNDLRLDAHRVVHARPLPPRRVCIAIIDSGLDTSHPAFADAFKDNRITTKSFLADRSLPADADDDGHGTHTAHLALQVAPRARLVAARVYQHGTPEAMEAALPAIASAIRWAVSEGAKVVSLSFGYRQMDAGVRAAIREAHFKGAIIIAAASNSGVNPRFPISFPASMRQVICMHSTDGEGNPSGRNPPPVPDCALAVLGEGVAAAWPTNLRADAREDGLRVASGTSVATPIAAGLAALILEYAMQGGGSGESVKNWRSLQHCDEMRKMFVAMARQRQGYLTIAPSSLFDYHGDDMHRRVCGKISDVLDSL
ncbi:peptidase S8/S53 domain-containing protein [Clohesyomyces aquaticus]|uniref:Peptidase S8/S53 domain-containing protein n=1 Tax=Clohesyomyces aquaticus TaxID=1231657 RepID=A0A1Y1ZFU9_9PLEO|nr:peptidase S8/S53 domain-containing protein [Clohesyomyces aquaticus]